MFQALQKGPNWKPLRGTRLVSWLLKQWRRPDLHNPMGEFPSITGTPLEYPSLFHTSFIHTNWDSIGDSYTRANRIRNSGGPDPIGCMHRRVDADKTAPETGFKLKA